MPAGSAFYEPECLILKVKRALEEARSAKAWRTRRNALVKCRASLARQLLSGVWVQTEDPEPRLREPSSPGGPRCPQHGGGRCTQVTLTQPLLVPGV